MTEGRPDVQSVSTRIRLDDGSAECVACGDAIEAGERHKVAAVEAESRVVYREFCTRECIDAWKSAATPPAE